jgi:glycosyltransferase involved in cell wall biosynthesis
MPDAIKVDFWNCEALADAICNVLRYKSLANTMKKNGSERIKNLTWDKAAKKLTRLYHELTTNHHRKKKPDIVFPGTSTTQAAHAPVF